MASPLNTPVYEVPNWLQYGNGTGAAGPEGSGKVGLYANQGKYTLVDNKTGNVLAEGSSPEELKAISDIISGTLVPQGNDADWRLYSTNPVVQTRPHRDFLGGGEGPLKLDGNPFGDVIQGYNDLSTPGDPRGVVIAGDQPNNFFKDMLLPLLAVPAATAGAYFGGNALLGAMGGGGGGGAGAGLSGITGASAANAVLPGLAGTVAPVGGMGGLGSLGAIGGGIGAGGAATGAGIGAGLSAGAGLTTAGVTPITVLAPQSLTALQAAGALAPGLGVPGAAAALGGGPSTAAPGASSGAGGGQTPGPGVVGPGGEIVVTGGAGNTVGLTAGQIAALTGGLGLTSAAGLGSGSASNPSSAADSTKPPKSTIDKIIDYTRLAGLGTSLIGSMFGGGGGGRTPFMGTGNRNPVFSAKLPAPSLPGGVSSMSARQMPEQNWYEYGFNPEQSFFNTSAPGYTPEPGKTPGMARGGDFAVNGPGDGRSDSIPARLSDGEYVIDAETVALLGNGSPKAGAERLDDFRVSIRKHKGRNLAQGKFSVKAKKPEAYLAGGRT